MTGGTAVLTGTEAAVAVRSYMVLGNRGIRFHRARVATALRTAAGRTHLARTLRRTRAPLSAPTGRTARTVRRTRRRRPSGSGRVGTASREPAPAREGR